MEFKELKTSDNKVVLNGNEYYWEFRLTPERHKRLRSAMIKIEFGEKYDLIKLLANAKSSYNDFNKGKNADGIIKLYNIIQQAQSAQTKEDPALEAVSLFLLRKGEDVTKVDESLLIEKIEDFKSEPIARDNFLELALNMRNGLREK